MQAKKTKQADSKKQPAKVQYGADWYAQTREAAKPRRTVREEMGELIGSGGGSGGGRRVGQAALDHHPSACRRPAETGLL